MSAGYLRLLSLFSLLMASICQAENLPTSADRLADAIRLIDQNHFQVAEESLAKIRDDSPIAAWVKFYQGKVAEKSDHAAEALAFYKSVPTSSPASLDSQVGQLRILAATAKNIENLKELEEQLASIDSLRLQSRNDLSAEIHYVRGVVAERRGERSAAHNEYLAARRWASPETRAKARSAAELLRNQTKEADKNNLATWLLDETQQLLKEQDLSAALANAQRAKSLALRKSEKYFQALLLEEQVVRAQGRKEEADRILATISSEATQLTAERATLKLIRSTWNRDETAKTLQMIQQYRRRFGDGSQPEELLYIEARCFEDSGHYSDARDAYLRLAASKDTATRLRALRPLAWMHFRRGEFTNAVEAFRRGMSEADSALEELNKTSAAPDFVRKLRDYTDEREHHRFWYAYLLNKLGPDAKKQLSFEVPDPQILWQAQIQQAPRSYYAKLARAAVSSRTTEALPVADDCASPLPESLTGTLEKLRNASLYQLAEYEIDWALGSNREKWQSSLDAYSGSKTFRPDELFFLLGRIEAYERYAKAARGVSMADSLYKRPLLPQEKIITSCMRKIRELAFPTPFLELYRAAAKDNNVSLPLVLALSRTESFFDPAAHSPSDARGLMQMLPSTARAEGLGENENLFDAATNIRYGTKHLAGLLKRFAQLEPYAIAAYNGGAPAVDRWKEKYAGYEANLWIEQISYPETRDYVKKVLFARDVYEQVLKE